MNAIILNSCAGTDMLVSDTKALNKYIHEVRNDKSLTSEERKQLIQYSRTQGQVMNLLLSMEESSPYYES